MSIRAIIASIGAGLLFGAPGCEQQPVDPQTAKTNASAASAAPASPASVAEHLTRLHRERDYAGLARLITPEHREDTIRFLKRIDGVLDENARLREIARIQYGESIRDAWDLSDMENNLGVFSTECRVLNQRFKGDMAIVTLQEGDHLPLVRAPFVLTADGWLYRADPPPVSLLPEIDRLASLLRELGREIEAGADSSAYIDAFAYRVMPQMWRVFAAREGAVATTESQD